MWLPQSAVDIERAVESGLFRETPLIAAQAEPGSAKSVAIDVAAMSTGGGVIVYGVREPDAKDRKRFVLSPIDLTGRRDWIDSIVKTSIDPVPYFEVHDFESTADADVGYLVVVVPKSDAAPHMMVSGGDNRFYGRSATGNCRLSEAEVAALYAAKHDRAVDRTFRSLQLEANSAALVVTRTSEGPRIVDIDADVDLYAEFLAARGIIEPWEGHHLAPRSDRGLDWRSFRVDDGT